MLGGQILQLGMMLDLPFMIRWIELLLLGMLGVDIWLGPVAEMGINRILILMGVGSGRAVRWIRMHSGGICQMGMMPALQFMIGWIELQLLGMLGVDIWLGPVA